MTVTAAPPAMLAFDVEVTAVRRLGPSMVRVTFGGECLSRFGDGGPLGPRDLRVKLMFPAPGHPLPDLSDLSAGWYQRWLALDPWTRGSMRTYTVRRARTAGAVPQIEIDFVLHGHSPTETGPGSGWAAQAAPGQRLVVIGPHAGTTAYGGIEWQPPTAADGGGVRVLLAGDETAVPAIGSILESLPSGYAGCALLEVPTAQDAVALDGGGVEVRWLARDGRARGELLGAAVREVLGAQVREVPGEGARPGGVPDLPEVDVDAEVLWDTPTAVVPDAGPGPGGGGPGEWYAWVAGEASVVRDLRRLLVRDLGLPRDCVAFMGYWRQGRAERV
jgi:NADPH-dependent ferric siderophore reductase